MGDEEKLLNELGITDTVNDVESLLTKTDAPKDGAADQDALAEEWAKALEAGEDVGQEEQSNLGEAKFSELKPTEQAGGPPRELDFILDIPLEVTVEIGRSRMLINDLLQIGQGSIIELNRLAGEPLDIYVNQKLIARGEVVVVGEKFGVRITDIVSPMERVKRLG